jgi:uncharacterized hydrophobic protein (TIGR00271 family)
MGLNNLLTKRIAKSELQNTVTKLLSESILKPRFFLLLFLSAAIATLGLLTENVSVTIGAMVIAPLLTPLLCFSLGGLSFKPKMIKFGLSALIFGSLLSILLSAGLVQVLGRTEIPESIMRLYSFNSFDFILIAFLSGMAGAFSSLKEETKDELIGVAIAAALIPPLAFAGIALGIGNIELFKETLILYGINLLATSLGAMVIYAIYMLTHRVDADQIKEKH